MNQTAPVLPSYETSVLEPNLDPKSKDPFGERFNTVYYQFLALLLKTVQPLSQVPVKGTAKPGALPNTASITLSGAKGIITTEPLATLPGGVYTLDLTNTAIELTSFLMLTVTNGTNTHSLAALESFLVDDQAATIRILNAGAAAFNGTLVIQFLVQ
jgi:hypothetical protein